MNDQIDSVIDINRHDLIGDWEKQGRLYRQEADKLTSFEGVYDERKAAVDIEEANLKTIAAQLRLVVHMDPEKAGLGKGPTLPVIEAYIITRAEYREQQQKIWQAVRERDKAKEVMNHQKNITKALEHKKEGLQNAVKLKLADYFADPKAPQGSREIYLEMAKDEVFGKRRHFREQNRNE